MTREEHKTTYTDKEIVKAYVEKLERKRKFTGKETGQILFLANINFKYFNSSVEEEKAKVIESVDFNKLLSKAQRSLQSDRDFMIFDVYKALHSVIENYYVKNIETLKLVLSNLQAISERARLVFEIEYAFNNKEIKQDSYLYNCFSLEQLNKNHFANELQYENLAETTRSILAYNELLKILEKEYGLYNLCDCYKFNEKGTIEKGINEINAWTNALNTVLPPRKIEIAKNLLPHINYEKFKPSEENIKEVSEEVKEIGLNIGAVNKYNYHFNDLVRYLTIDCIDNWEVTQDSYSTIELLNRINKLEVKQLRESRERNSTK